VVLKKFKPAVLRANEEAQAQMSEAIDSVARFSARLVVVRRQKAERALQFDLNLADDGDMHDDDLHSDASSTVASVCIIFLPRYLVYCPPVSLPATEQG
jgi:hypothetical protein